MTKIKCSILLATLFIVIAVDAASLHKKYVKNIPVRVIYERSNNFNSDTAKNIDQQPPVAASLPDNKNEQKENEKIVEKPNLDSECKDKEINNKNLSEKVQLSPDQLRQHVNLVPKIVTPAENNDKQESQKKDLSLIDETRRVIDSGINKIKDDVKVYNSVKIDDSKWKDLNASLENNINLLNQKVGTKQDAPPAEAAPAPAPAPSPAQPPNLSAAWQAFLQNVQSSTNGFVQNVQEQWGQIQSAGQEFINNCCNGAGAGIVSNEENQGQPPNFLQVIQNGFSNLQQQLQNLQNQFSNAINNNPAFNSPTPSTVLGDVDLDEPATSSPVQSAQNFFNQVGTAVQNLNPFRPTAPPASLGDVQATTQNPIVSAFQGAGNQIQNFFSGAQNILGGQSGQPSQPTAAPVPVQPQEPAALPVQPQEPAALPVQPQEPAALPERMKPEPEIAASSELPAEPVPQGSAAAPQQAPAAPQESSPVPQESSSAPPQQPSQPSIRQQEIPQRNATTIQPPSTDAKVQKEETMIASE